MIRSRFILIIFALDSPLLGVESFSEISCLSKISTPLSSTSCFSTRRSFLVEQTAALASSAALVLINPQAANALDEDNEFIQELKVRSEANSERYKKEVQSGTIGPGKIDYTQRSKYKKPKYIGIRRQDGSYKMVTPDVAEELQKKGLVIAEYDTVITKEGIEKFDYKKGMILKFKDERAQVQVDKKSPKPSPASLSPPPTPQSAVIDEQPKTAPPAPELFSAPAPAPAPEPVVIEEPPKSAPTPESVRAPVASTDEV